MHRSSTVTRKSVDLFDAESFKQQITHERITKDVENPPQAYND